MKKLGMVIINYNDYDMTKRLIDNVKDYTIIDKIVIVDNCSTDDSYERLQNLNYMNVDLIKTDKNGGYAYGLNYGAKYILKTLIEATIIFSNTDVIIKSESDLNKLSNDITDEVKVVGPVIEEHGRLNRGWKKTTPFKEMLFNLPLISRYFKNKLLYYKDEHYSGEFSNVDVVSGCFFLVDGKTLRDVDYFDPNTFLYYEEFILSSKIRNISKKIMIDNRVHIIHDHSVTIDKSFKRVEKYKILKKSQRYYVKKYLDANIIQMFFLWLTNKLSLLILNIRCLLNK